MQCSDVIHFLRGQAIGAHGIDACDPRRIRHSARSVARQDFNGKTRTFQRGNRSHCARPQTVGKADRQRCARAKIKPGHQTTALLLGSRPACATDANGLALPQGLRAESRHFGDRCKSGPFTCLLCNGFGQRMRRGIRQRQGNSLRFRRQILPVHHLRRPFGQGARFVKNNRIDSGQTLQRSGVFDQNAFAKQCARGGRGDRRHGQTQSAGTGYDQNGSRNVQRHAHIPRPDQPADKSQCREDMDAGRIERCGPVGQRRIVRPPRLGDSDQIGQPVQRCFAAHCRGTDGQRAADHNLARRNGSARTGRYRDRFACQQGPVKFCVAFGHDTVHGHAAACADQHQVTDTQLRHRAVDRHATDDPGGPGHFKGGEFFGSGTGRRTGPKFEVATGQKEETQRQRRVEIGVMTRKRRFPERRAERQDNRQRNGHIHRQPPHGQRPPCAHKKRLPCKGDSRQSNGGGNPMKHVTGRVRSPGPDRHRQQHHVHRGKASHGQTHQERLACAGGFGAAQDRRVKRLRQNAGLSQCSDQGIVRYITAGRHISPLERQVYPSGGHIVTGQQGLFRIADTDLAVNFGQGQEDVVGLGQWHIPIQRHSDAAGASHWSGIRQGRHAC
mmetsp:Transcript_18518/g.30302  ORF Transcript_18518/g.30302 Transcript_18518/m.30302 type:complete len:613 (+) Transcript_18518:2199-4037(+)